MSFFTVYELEIVLHYYACSGEFPHSPIFERIAERLVGLGLITPTPPSSDGPKYAITEQGRAFVEIGLMSTQIPVQKWIMPPVEPK